MTRVNSGSLRVGVIGGGQLARMMIPPALHLGLDITVMAEDHGMSANRAVDTVGDYRETQRVLDFAASVDVVTFDHEHVPPQVLAALEDAGHSVHPRSAALQYAQDKLLMRARLSELGAPVPAWRAVADLDQLADFMREHNGAAVLKTPRGGYDGKGVMVVRGDAEDARQWFARLQPGETLLVEQLVDFRRELSQLIARTPSGEIRAWPLVETAQHNGVCKTVTAPAPADCDAESAAQIARQIAAGLGVTGVMAVELFELADGSLLVNELAMRPHNSGHFTIEGSVTSQFEQHLRAVCDLPLGATEMTAPAAVMVNILGGPAEGSMLHRYDQVLRDFPAVKVHSYGKKSRPHRKVGHVTALSDSAAAAAAAAHAAADLFN